MLDRALTLNEILRTLLKKRKHLCAAQEIDAHCRQIIHDHHQWIRSWSDKPRPEPHSFRDIVAQVSPVCWRSEDTFLEKWLAMSPLALQSHQYCDQHGGLCPCLQPVDVDFSGLPCQHNSRANRNRLFQDGPHSDIYIVWAKKHTALETPLLILENTPDRFSGSVRVPFLGRAASWGFLRPGLVGHNL